MVAGAGCIAGCGGGVLPACGGSFWLCGFSCVPRWRQGTFEGRGLGFRPGRVCGPVVCGAGCVAAAGWGPAPHTDDGAGAFGSRPVVHVA